MKNIKIEFTQDQIDSLIVAVRLRIDALNENNEPDRDYGWKVIKQKLERAIRNNNGGKK